MIQHSPNDNWTNFLIICVTTAIILFDFGWFREQFCLIMCPYGRFQSVLMDKNSMAVLYDAKRGEPRRTKDTKDNSGDCVNCYRCVSVCPTGIDIRNGLQMECIACTACIDACDEIMEKVNKPKGLIRYGSEASLLEEKTQNVRPRTLLYGAILIFLGIGFSISLAKKKAVDFSIIRAVEEPYKVVTTHDGSEEVVNHFKVHIQNQSTSEILTEYKLKAENADYTLVAPDNPARTGSGQKKWIHFFVKVNKEKFKNLTNKELQLEFTTKGKVVDIQTVKTITLLGPEN